MIVCPRCERPAKFDRACDVERRARQERMDRIRAAADRLRCDRCGSPRGEDYRSSDGTKLCFGCSILEPLPHDERPVML